jgi:propanediol dehydratase small subunit
MEWTPNELANALRNWIGNREQLLAAANMLRQQAETIVVYLDLLREEQHENKQLKAEIEHLKNKVQYWKGLHK